MTGNRGLKLDGVVAAFPGWSLLEVGGSRRERFLASQVTSDVAGLASGDSQLSALLDRSGRLQAFFFLCKRADVIDVLIPDEIIDACLERFENHIIADDVTLARRHTGVMRLVLGPTAAADQSTDERFPVKGWGSVGFVTWGKTTIDLPEIAANELETRRVLGGPPAWGREVQPDQLINETALLDTAVSFDKGCYLGQETVAKVATHRGAVRGPVLLELTGRVDDVERLVGKQFAVGGRKRAGMVLSCARWEGSTWIQVSLHRELRVIGRPVRCVFADDRVVDAVIRRLPHLVPPSPEEMAGSLTVAASTAFTGDQPDRALELLRRAVAICPSYADAHESMGVILGRLGRHPEAIEQMQRLVELNPSSTMAHSNLSLFFNQLGEIDQAEHHLAMATRLSMGTPEANDSADRKPTEHAEGKEANRRRREEMFRQVLAIDPDDALAHFGIGELLAERGDFGDAVVHFEQTVAADPTHSSAIFALGQAFEEMGKTERALATYEHGIEIAAKKGDLATAHKMQDRLTALRAS